MKHMFPFKAIPYGSRIIIYGAGRVGQEYLLQLNESGYAKVICLMDVQAERYQELDVKVCYPADIDRYDYDYVVVAINNKTYAADAVQLLLKSGVPKEKLICQVNRWPELEVLPDRSEWVANELLAVGLYGTITIAVRIVGGIGDCLVRKRHLEELLSWDKDIVVDVYTEPKRCGVLKWLLEDNPQVHMVVGNISQLNYMKRKYAAAFAFGYTIDLLAWNPEKFQFHPTLKEKIQQIEVTSCNYGVLDTGLLMPVEFHRAEKDQLNFYTAYNRYGAFNIEDWHTNVPLSAKGATRLQEILPKGRHYITISCGCDTTVGHNKEQAKAWPYIYWEKLINLLHEYMPNIAVVQVDSEDFPRLPGCDAYIVGESLDVAVHALKCAKLHIDNDGGLVHLATQLGTKCVVLFGPTPVDYYGYEENINIQAGSCHNCYWLTGTSLSCYRNMDKPECMYSITPEIVLEKIKKQFN